VLEWKVDIFYYLWFSCHYFQQTVGHAIRVTVKNTNPVEAVNFAQLGQQFIQRIFPVQVLTVFGGVLCNEVEFLDTAFSKTSCLFENVLHLSGTEAPTNQRDCTVAALVVTAFCNL